MVHIFSHKCSFIDHLSDGDGKGDRWSTVGALTKFRLVGIGELKLEREPRD